MKIVQHNQSKEQLAYEQRSKELEEINRIGPIRPKKTITIGMDQIFHLRTNKSQKVFQFQLLTQMLSPLNNQFIQRLNENQSLKIGIQIGINSVRYYSVKKIKLSKDGRLYDVSLVCFSLEERNYLINLYNSLDKKG